MQLLNIAQVFQGQLAGVRGDWRMNNERQCGGMHVAQTVIQAMELAKQTRTLKSSQ